MVFGALLLLCSLGFAEEPAASAIEINRVADIYPHLPPPGAKRWDPAKLLVAVEASTRRWSPNDVYELIDREVPEPIIKVVAGKVGLFYDGSQKPLHVIASEARLGAGAETVTADGSVAPLFSWFEDIFKAMNAAEDELGVPSMRAKNETQSLYERRMRAYDEDRAKKVGPLEGRIQSASFDVTLPAAVANVGGCERPVAIGDASQVDFDLFRKVAGTRNSDTLVNLASHSAEKMMFSVAPSRRIEAQGRCGAKASTLKVIMKRSAEGTWTASGDFK